MEIHGYGRQLLAAQKTKEALEVFKLNAQKHPGNPTASIGLVRAYSALGDYKNALKFANLALAQKPDEANRKAVEDMIAKLKAGQDVN
ncbi:MAG: tetratricopeptide repeat protein [Bernardetiaceae bacterium]|nr:tetratricopeptide repeat protein [Bernardetiaceae bacterium]